MKIIIDIDVINGAIGRMCPNKSECEGNTSCMECAGIEKDEYVEIISEDQEDEE